MEFLGPKVSLATPGEPTRMRFARTLPVELTVLVALPAGLGALRTLRKLDLSGCDALGRMPDLSRLKQLQVKLPWRRLGKWETVGRRAGDFGDDPTGLDPSDEYSHSSEEWKAQDARERASTRCLRPRRRRPWSRSPSR